MLYFGVPVGNETYQITITEMCINNDNDENLRETSNSVISSVTVYEGYMKLYINGIDYDLIRNFKTGYGQKFMLNSVADFNSENIYGWNDVENIDVYVVDNNGDITYELLKGVVIRNIHIFHQIFKKELIFQMMIGFIMINGNNYHQ